MLPIQRAEELLATLPGVLSARIVAGIGGVLEEIHILIGAEVTAKQTVRNVEGALIAHLGVRVSSAKISVTTTDGGRGPQRMPFGAFHLPMSGAEHIAVMDDAIDAVPRMHAPAAFAPAHASDHATENEQPGRAAATPPRSLRRRIYFDDVEVRRSRTKGIACRVTLRNGDQLYVGETEGVENERLRLELAARATLAAISQIDGGELRILSLEGCKIVEAFERQFVFVGVVTKTGRESVLTTGSAEIRESPETASVLAVLDATNRWLERSQ